MWAVIKGNGRTRRKKEGAVDVDGTAGAKNDADRPRKRRDGKERKDKPANEIASNEKSAQESTTKWNKVAIVYLPHLGHGDISTTEDLATRLSCALGGTHDEVTYEARDASATIRYGERRPKNSAKSSSVVATHVDGTKSSLDVFEFDYSTSLSEGYEGASLLSKSMRLLTTVAFNLGRLLASLVSGRTDEKRGSARVGVVMALVLTALSGAYFFPGPRDDWSFLIFAVLVAAVTTLSFGFVLADSVRVKAISLIGAASTATGATILEWASDSDRVQAVATSLLTLGVFGLVYATLKNANPDLGQRIQLGIGFGILALFSMYGLVLLGAVITQVIDALADEGAVHDAAARAKDPLTGVALTLTAVGIAVSAKDLRRHLVNGTMHLLGAVRYLSMGDGVDVQVSRLNLLIAKLRELGYKRIDIVAYSFGSIIALDGLFPRKDCKAALQMTHLVDHLVTIGCPAMTIGTFWPHHWEGRDPSWDPPPVETEALATRTKKADRWINIYSPFDVLSSKFLRLDETTKEPTQELDPKAALSLCPKQSLIHLKDHGSADKHAEAGTPPAYVPRPSREAAFPLGPSPDDLSPLQMAALQGLRAHGNYWRTPYADDLGAVALFADVWRGNDWGHTPEPPKKAVKATDARHVDKHIDLDVKANEPRRAPAPIDASNS